MLQTVERFSDGSGFAIGGLVTLNELAEDPSVMTGMSAIAQAASVGTPKLETSEPWLATERRDLGAGIIAMDLIALRRW